MPLFAFDSKTSIVFVALLGLVFQSCGASSTAPRSSLDFIAEDIEGASVALSDFDSSKAVLVSFFASWCEPCKDEMRFLQSLHDKYHSQGATLISVSVDEPDSQEDVKTYIRTTGYDYPVVIDIRGEASGQLNPSRAVPYSVIIKAGKIVWRHEGFVPSDETLIEQALLDALN